MDESGEFTKLNEKSPKKGITRRDFLKKLGIAAITSPFILELAKNAFIEAVGHMFTSNKLSGQVNDKLLIAIEKLNNEENPKQKPMLTLIADAVESYESKTGRKTSYRKDPSFRPEEQYKGLLGEFKNKPFFQLKSNDFANAVIKSFSDREQAAYEASFNFFLGLQAAACPGSGYYHRLREKFGDALDANLQKVDNPEKYRAIEESIYQDIKETREELETHSQGEQHPTSSSKIFEHFLAKNNGNIAESLLDTAIFLKFVTRNNIDKRGEFVGDKQESTTNINWIKANVLDEFGGPSYSQIETNNPSALNLIGKPYHSWFLVSLLQFFPESVIQAGSYYELFRHMDEHGVGKIKADLKTLSDLSKVSDYLNSKAK